MWPCLKPFSAHNPSKPTRELEWTHISARLHRHAIVQSRPLPGSARLSVLARLSAHRVLRHRRRLAMIRSTSCALRRPFLLVLAAMTDKATPSTRDCADRGDILAISTRRRAQTRRVSAVVKHFANHSDWDLIYGNAKHQCRRQRDQRLSARAYSFDKLRKRAASVSPRHSGERVMDKIGLFDEALLCDGL